MKNLNWEGTHIVGRIFRRSVPLLFYCLFLILLRMLRNEGSIVKIVDLHGLAYICERLRSFGACHLRAFLQDFIYERDVLLILGPSFSDRLQDVFHDVEEELLAGAVAKASSLIMSLHLVEV